MNRTTIGRIATVALLLGTATVACTPDAHVASVSDAASPRDTKAAARRADVARDAIAARKGEKAVAAAEKAVALAPNNADYRMVLGQAYLVAGRFASAEAAFRDSLTLSPAQPRATFNLALAQIGQGRAQAAQETLGAAKGDVPDSDLGLALALAGERAQGIALLTDLVTSGKSDARTRQNLALALALDGRWREARGVAMQDTPPDRINDQIAGWADLARPGQAGRQVATMLGTQPALADPGMPTRLALAAPTAAAPVALALAAPETPAAPPPATPAPVRTVALALDTPAPEPVAVPAMLAAPAEPVPSQAIAPAPLVRTVAARAAPAPKSRSVAPGPELMAVREGGFVVQLGAFARAGAIDVAWARAAKLTPNVVRFTPVKGSTSLSGATLVRISVGGFKTRADAAAFCTRLKAQGQACFVRGLGNDAPMQWVRKDNGQEYQLAALPAPPRA